MVCLQLEKLGREESKRKGTTMRTEGTEETGTSTAEAAAAAAATVKVLDKTFLR